MICCLLKLFSSSTATSDSSILRRHLRSRVRNRVRASCIEIVEPPSFIRPARRSSRAARAMPMASMPPCRKKLLSSEASSAFSITGGISPSLSMIRRSRAKEAKTLPSTASSCVTRLGVKVASAPTCGTWMRAATLTPTVVPISTASSGQVQRNQRQRRLWTPGVGRGRLGGGSCSTPVIIGAEGRRCPWRRRRAAAWSRLGDAGDRVAARGSFVDEPREAGGGIDGALHHLPELVDRGMQVLKGCRQLAFVHSARASSLVRRRRRCVQRADETEELFGLYRQLTQHPLEGGKLHQFLARLVSGELGAADTAAMGELDLGEPVLPAENGERLADVVKGHPMYLYRHEYDGSGKQIESLFLPNQLWRCGAVVDGPGAGGKASP